MKKKIVDFISNHLFLSFLILSRIILLIIKMFFLPNQVLFILLNRLFLSDGIVAYLVFYLKTITKNGEKDYF